MADPNGYGWAITKALAEAGATVAVGVWPPALKIFETNLRRGKFDEQMKLADGTKMVIDKIYPQDAVYDTPEDVPEEIKTNKRYAGLDGFTISEVAAKVSADYPQGIDVLVHSIANGPDVKVRTAGGKGESK
jgi:enoyl-[acyl-carrier protein] reductase I